MNKWGGGGGGGERTHTQKGRKAEGGLEPRSASRNIHWECAVGCVLA